jgi:hypothetical protein
MNVSTTRIVQRQRIALGYHAYRDSRRTSNLEAS